MILNLTDISAEPLYLQISRRIRARILAGELVAGAILPSIRTLARENRVSVITVQRAYDDLEREGYLLVHHGKGYFVANLSDELRKRTARERLFERLVEAVALAGNEGLTPADIKEMFGVALRQPLIIEGITK